MAEAIIPGFISDTSGSLNNFELKYASHGGGSSSQSSYTHSVVFNNEHDSALIVCYHCIETEFTNQTTWTFSIILLLHPNESQTISPYISNSSAKDTISFASNKKTISATLFQTSSYGSSYLQCPSMLYAYGF